MVALSGNFNFEDFDPKGQGRFGHSSSKNRIQTFNPVKNSNTSATTVYDDGLLSITQVQNTEKKN